MTTFDLSPLFRTSVGFDRLASLLNTAHRTDQGSGYPPYNIQTAGENRYRITMAIAGFSEEELKITSEHNKLFVTGDKAEEKEDDEENPQCLGPGDGPEDGLEVFVAAGIGAACDDGAEGGDE